jgi:hypothetical protein
MKIAVENFERHFAQISQQPSATPDTEIEAQPCAQLSEYCPIG